MLKSLTIAAYVFFILEYFYDGWELRYKLLYISELSPIIEILQNENSRETCSRIIETFWIEH